MPCPTLTGMRAWAHLPRHMGLLIYSQSCRQIFFAFLCWDTRKTSFHLVWKQAAFFCLTLEHTRSNTQFSLQGLMPQVPGNNISADKTQEKQESDLPSIFWLAIRYRVIRTAEMHVHETAHFLWVLNGHGLFIRRELLSYDAFWDRHCNCNIKPFNLQFDLYSEAAARPYGTQWNNVYEISSFSGSIITTSTIAQNMWADTVWNH